MKDASDYGPSDDEGEAYDQGFIHTQPALLPSAPCALLSLQRYHSLPRKEGLVESLCTQPSAISKMYSFIRKVELPK